MDDGPVATLRKGGVAHAAATHAASHVEQYRNARRVAVGSLVVRGELMEKSRQYRQRHEQEGDDHDHVENDIGYTLGMEEQRQPQNEQDGNENHGPQVDPTQHGKRRHEGRFQLRAHLPAVVACHENDLPATRAACFGGVTGLVLRHDVLADAASKRFGEDGTVEHLGGQQQQSDQGHDEGRNDHNRQEQRQHGHDQSDPAANGARRVGAARTGKVLDNRRQAGFFLHLLGDVERGLLLFFRPGRTWPDLLR